MVGESGLESAPAKQGKSNMMKIVGLVAVIILIEIGIISFFLPGSGGQSSAPAEEIETSRKVDDLSNDPASVAEVPIGNGFSCTNSRAAAGTTVHIDFKLVALVAADQALNFETKLKEHDARVRQAIIKVARSTSLEDLNDPNLSTIKRLIREEINKILRKSYITEVVISEFTTMEQ